MKHLAAAGTVVILLSIMLSAPYYSVPTGPFTVRAQPSATVGVWSSVYGSNITDLSLIPGTSFDVKVNITGAGRITAYDVILSYDFVAIGPPCDPVTERCVLDSVSGTLSGGLIDPNNAPSGCNVLVSKFEVFRPPTFKGRIRVAVVISGGCSVDGNGTLFTIAFQVLAEGATTINVVETDSSGFDATIIVGQGAVRLPYSTVNAYFRNKAGVPPVADFTFDPPNPVREQAVTFDATTSFDPSNSTQGSDKGIKRYVWSFGDNTVPVEGASQSHVFVKPVSIPATGNFSVTLVVWDYDNELPRGVTKVVRVGEATVHDVLVLSPSLDKSVVTAGETLGVRVTVSNRGTVADAVNLVVSFDYNGTTVVANQTGINLDRGGSRQFNYELQTTGLPSRTYTVTATVAITNPDGGTIPDAQPSDNTRGNTFTVVGTSGGTSLLSTPLLVGTLIAVLVIVWAVVYGIRRRAKKET